jgi:iron(III) transport system permease protein
LRGSAVVKSEHALNRILSTSTLIVVLAFLSAYPLLTLFYGSIHSAPPGGQGSYSLDGYRLVLSSENFVILLDTVGIAFVKSFLSISLAIGLAWIVARTDTPYRRSLEILITLPFFVPPILTAMAWAMLGNPKVGTLNIVARWLTGMEDISPIDVYSYSGVIWHMMQYSTAFLFMFMVDAFRAMDPSLEEASRMSGASRFTTFRRTTLMLMLPVLTSGFILTFIRGLESFESPLFFGSPVGIKVLTTEIYDAINQRARPNYQYATALSFSMMILMCLIVIALWRILGGRSFQTVTGKGYSPGLTKLGGWRWLTFGLVAFYIAITLVLPIGQLLLGSFFRFFGFYSLDMLTLDNYRAVAANDTFWHALGNTMLLGLGGATLTMVLGTAAAYVTVRTRWRGRRLIEILAWLPWMMPGMVLGLGFLWAFAMIPGPIQLYGTVWALMFAYIALGSPLSVRVMSASFMQLSYDLEECSRIHGATWLQTMQRILVALAWPAFAVGWILTFFMVLRELSASILLYSAGSEVLSVVILRLWIGGKAEEVSVIGLFIVALVLLFRFVQLKILSRRLVAIP